MSNMHRSNFPEAPATMSMETKTDHERTDTIDPLAQPNIKIELGNGRENIDPNAPVRVRRGFLPWLCMVPSVQDPQSYSSGVKWFLTFIVAAGGLVVPLSSGVLFRKLSPFPFVDTVKANMMVVK